MSVAQLVAAIDKLMGDRAEVESKAIVAKVQGKQTIEQLK